MRILFTAAAFTLAIAFVLSAMPTGNAAVYQQGIVYVIYEEEGDAAPIDNTDLNINGVPDVVEDVATQVNAARELFKDVFKFPDPLESERFKDVTSIEIDIESKQIMGRWNGNSSQRVRKQSKHDPNERALHFRVANTVNPRKNSTPAHEYFHLLQYGVTYFRNNWFKEGTARWAQDSVRKIKYPDGKNVPSMLEDKMFEEKLFQGSYDMAEQFWYPLVVNMNDKAKIPDSLVTKYRYVNGSPVFQDDTIYGPNVIREVILVMKSKEPLAAAEYGTLKQWRKKGQQDERNNKFILASVREVYYGKL
ncbi:MAG: hypothetical protein SR1Q5_00050 [Quinella sp. 1Q5]|nr:hypothetical protein [Quinella sp. 1Q5]